MDTEKPATSRFWDFNIGHLATLIVFIFGLGFSWAKLDGRIEAVDHASISRHDEAIAQIARVKSENGLTGEFFEKRVAKLETNQLVIDDLRTTVSKLTYQVDSLNKLIEELRNDIKSQAQYHTGKPYTP